MVGPFLEQLFGLSGFLSPDRDMSADVLDGDESFVVGQETGEHVDLFLFRLVIDLGDVALQFCHGDEHTGGFPEGIYFYHVDLNERLESVQSLHLEARQLLLVHLELQFGQVLLLLQQFLVLQLFLLL